MVALVNVVKMPGAQVSFIVYASYHALKSVPIETIQGFLGSPAIFRKTS